MRWRSPWIRLGMVVILGVALAAGWASFRQYERSLRIQDEINVLEREAERVARENETLSQKIQYFASPDFKEEEAKEKLGLRRQEEKVIMIDGTVEPVSGPQADTGVTGAATVTWERPNYEKWWERFSRRTPQ